MFNNVADETQCMDNYFNSNKFSFSQTCQNSLCNHIIDALCVYVNIQNTFFFGTDTYFIVFKCKYVDTFV